MGESTAARLTISGLRPKVVSMKEMEPKQGIENEQEMRQKGTEMAKQKRVMQGGKLPPTGVGELVLGTTVVVMHELCSTTFKGLY